MPNSPRRNVRLTGVERTTQRQGRAGLAVQIPASRVKLVFAAGVSSSPACQKSARSGTSWIVVQLGGIPAAAPAAANARSTSPGATTLSDPSAPSASYAHATGRTPTGLPGNPAREPAPNAPPA